MFFFFGKNVIMLVMVRLCWVCSVRNFLCMWVSCFVLVVLVLGWLCFFGVIGVGVGVVGGGVLVGLFFVLVVFSVVSLVWNWWKL